MRALTALLLSLMTLPVLADPAGHPGRGPSRELLHASRHLESAAGHLYVEVRELRGRSEATSRARDLLDAARDLRRLVARDAPLRKIAAAHQRVEYRNERLARLLLNPRVGPHRGPAVAALREFERASARVERALERQRYAWGDGRDDGRQRRYDDWRTPWPYR